MKFMISLHMSLPLFLGCKHPHKQVSDFFDAVRIETIIEDSLLNIRAIELNTNTLVAVSSIGDRYSIDLRTIQF